MNQADELSKAERCDAERNGLAAALFNIDGLGKEAFGFAEEKLHQGKFEQEKKECSGMEWKTTQAKSKHGSNTPGTQWRTTDIDPREIEIYFDNSSTLKNLEKDRSGNISSRFETHAGRVVGSDFTDSRRVDRDVGKNTRFSTRTSQGHRFTACDKNVSFAEFPSVIADPKWSEDIYGLSSTGAPRVQISDLGEARLDGNSPHGLRIINQHRLGDEIMEEPWDRGKLRVLKG